MKAYVKLLGGICITYIITMIIIHFLGNWHNYDVYALDGHISVDIIRTDGTYEHYDSNKFPMLNRGDWMVATIEIPQEYELENPTLCFHVYNCVMKLYFEGEEFYRFGEDLAAGGTHIGTVYEEVLFPKEAIGKYLILECVANENQAMNQLTDVTVMEATDSAKAPVVNNLFEMMMFITIFVVACMALFILVFSNIKDKIVRMGIWIALFSLMVSIYILSSQGLLYVLINSQRVVANLEYLSLFSLPIPFGAYFYEMYSDTKYKKILWSMAVFYVIFFIVCTVLNYTTTNYHFCCYLVPLHVAMVLGILLYVVLSFLKVTGADMEEWSKIIRNGVVFLLVVGLFDVLRFNLNQHSASVIFKLTFLPMGMIVMIVSLLTGAMMQLMNRYKEKEEKRQLERLAYVDIMTGLSNRAKCYAYVEEMVKASAKEFAIIFIDLNNLKTINDKYGHELGDLYIKTAADTMKSCFADADIISRFGGDEFVVLYDKNCEKIIDKLQEDFAAEIKRMNTEEQFPFQIGAACGAVISTKEKPLEVEVAINMADKVMYENKKKMKETLK